MTWTIRIDIEAPDKLCAEAIRDLVEYFLKDDPRGALARIEVGEVELLDTNPKPEPKAFQNQRQQQQQMQWQR